MNKVSFPFIVLVFIIPLSIVGQSIDDLMPVRGLCIQLPSTDRIDDFITFIEEDLAPNGVNTLVLRVDYNYEYDSHPELRRESAVSRKQVKKIVKAAKKSSIDLIPRSICLGTSPGMKIPANCYPFIRNLMKHRKSPCLKNTSGPTMTTCIARAIAHCIPECILLSLNWLMRSWMPLKRQLFTQAWMKYSI